ncbi:MAG: hypothetical protein MHPSP_001221 [Paramarteilia canceri]
MAWQVAAVPPKPLRVTDIVPDFSLDIVHPGGREEKFSLKKQIDKKRYSLLLFYPSDFTYVCPTELMAFSRLNKEFQKEQTDVIGISTDSIHAHRAYMEAPLTSQGLENKLEIPLGSDRNWNLSSLFNVLQPDGTSQRGLFIIGDNGELLIQMVSSLGVGRNPQEALRLLQAIKHWKKSGDGNTQLYSFNNS